jgi:hypothetical protein
MAYDSEEEMINKDERKSGSNRKVFIANYGVDLEFPGYYCFDSKFVPHDEGLIIALSWHVLP